VVKVFIAHYGGIDEIGIFVIPAVLAILALRWTERKARQRAEADAAGDQETGTEDTVSDQLPPHHRPATGD
jgi:hypothetical protein